MTPKENPQNLEQYMHQLEDELIYSITNGDNTAEDYYKNLSVKFYFVTI